MNEQEQPILIVGGGITGLSLAYELQKLRIPYVVLEAGEHTGGTIQSLQKEGFELDAGPNSIGATPHTLSFIREIGLQDALLEANATSKKRYLLRNNQLHAISPHPAKIMSSAYIGTGSKWKLFTEKFRKSKPQHEDESVQEFITRRFNKEISDYLFDPVLSGIYAGDPARLSVKEVLPALPRWEKEYGSVFSGLMKNKGAMGGRKIISFKGGSVTLIKRLQALLTGPVRSHCRVLSIQKDPHGYLVNYQQHHETASLTVGRVVFTSPAYSTADIIEELDAATADVLRGIHYPRMGVLHLGFDRAAIRNMPEGFGFLVPKLERKHFLGAICNSMIFPSKAPADKVLLTVFIGGVLGEIFFDEYGSSTLQDMVVKEVSEILQATAAPVMRHFSNWERAIPQPNVGFGHVRTAVQQFQEAYPGLHIAGNYLSGVAVPAILLAAANLAKELEQQP